MWVFIVEKGIGEMSNYTTQMDAARKGIVTPEMEIVSAYENMDVEQLRELVAKGQVAIPANKNHKCLKPFGIGNKLKTKINVNELLEECRLKNAFNISEVEFAILETNGQVSVQPKSENLPVTIKDMAIDSEYKGLCANIIIDGNIIDETLQCLGKTKKWAENEIKKSGVTDISDILLAFMDSNGKISIYKKSDSPKVKTVI